MDTDISSYDRAMVEAVALANRTNRAVDVMKNAFGGFSVSVIALGGDGSFTGQVHQVVRPGDPLTARQVTLRDAS